MAEEEPLAFPVDVDEFDLDERISFSKLDNKHIAVGDDGNEYEFDPQTRRWMPLQEEDEEGGVQDDENFGSVPIGELVADQEAPAPSRKRKKDSEVSWVQQFC